MADQPISAKWLESYTGWYLERWSTTEQGLRRVLMRKLRERGGDPALIDAELARLVRLGWLNDERFAEQRARAQHRRGLSGRRIRTGLIRAGVDAEAVETALSARSEGEDPDRDAALHWARKRGLGPFRKVPLDPERRKKELARLVRAGFAYGLAVEIVDGLADRREHWSSESE